MTDGDLWEHDKPLRQAVIDRIEPIGFDVTVWLDGNYVSGRIDVADQHGVIGRCLDALRALPVEQRMEAMGMVHVGWYGAQSESSSPTYAEGLPATQRTEVTDEPF